MSKHLHIVCLDAPYPVDYGGAVDMFGKIKALHKAGIHIHLHYFDYKQRGDATELSKYCESVKVYERKEKQRGFSFTVPYIVSSRTNDELIADLNKTNYPVIIEGIHCMGVVAGITDTNRNILVRLHNDEHIYYKKLAGMESNLIRKAYFMHESKLLKKYQQQLPHHIRYVCVSKKDQQVFQEQYQLPHVEFMPVFITWDQLNCVEGMGSFCLYHGNLSVAENEKAACWLIDKVFNRLKVPLVIAGKNPSRRLQKIAHLYQHTCIVVNPSEKEMNDLLEKAHINVLPSFNDTGVKLKLLHALYKGRHCVVNPAAVDGSGLEDACHIGTNCDAIASIIMQLYHQPFNEEEIKLRRHLLSAMFDSDREAQRLIAWLY